MSWVLESMKERRNAYKTLALEPEEESLTQISVRY